MSQDQALIILRTFGPIPSKGMAAAFGQSKAAVTSSLKGLLKCGDAKYIKIAGQRGHHGLWDSA